MRVTRGKSKHYRVWPSGVLGVQGRLSSQEAAAAGSARAEGEREKAKINAAAAHVPPWEPASQGREGGREGAVPPNKCGER